MNTKFWQKLKIKLALINTLLIFSAFMNDSIDAKTQDKFQSQSCSNLLNTDVNDIDGKPVNLCKYKGKVLLIVNTASKCGFTGQYKDLEILYEKYKDKGLEILAFPSNDFASQEPGNEEQIKKFCTLSYKTTFPLFTKVHVKGKEQNEFYQKLTKSKGDVTWNFQKYIIGKNGEVIKKFAPWVSPTSKSVEETIRAELMK
jgi:glutathione peroxidase